MGGMRTEDENEGFSLVDGCAVGCLVVGIVLMFILFFFFSLDFSVM